MKHFTLYFVLLLVIGCSQEQNIESKPIEISKNFTVLALGDSLTEGLGVKQVDNYPSILEKLLPENIQVINAGLSGETSSGLKSRLNWVLTQNPDLIILNIGANDAMRGLPLELTLNNIDQIIVQIKQSNADVILAGMQIYDNLGKEYVKGFSEIYPQLAKKHNLPLIPFFLEGVAGDPRFNQADMIHPNAKGYQIIVENNILPTLTTYFKKQNL
jgi:acyl-CoA thioesterase-1